MKLPLVEKSRVQRGRRPLGLHPPLHLAKKTRGGNVIIFLKSIHPCIFQKNRGENVIKILESQEQFCQELLFPKKIDTRRVLDVSSWVWFLSYCSETSNLCSLSRWSSLCWVRGCRSRMRRRRRPLLSWMQVSLPFTFWGAVPFSSQFLIFL